MHSQHTASEHAHFSQKGGLNFIMGQVKQAASLQTVVTVLTVIQMQKWCAGMHALPIGAHSGNCSVGTYNCGKS